MGMPMLQTAIGVLSDNPELVVVLAVVLRVARAYQTSLTWPEYRAIHRFKRGVFPFLDELVGDRVPLVRDKAGAEDEEFVATVQASVRETVRTLRASGGSLHLLNSIKRRPDTHGDPLTAAHVVWQVGDGKQVEAYLFRNEDGTTDVYAHTETSTDDPLGHLTDQQIDGDKYGVLPKLA